MKPLRFFLFALLLLNITIAPPALGCDARRIANYTPIAERQAQHLLYVVHDCKNPPSYVFGTIHLDDEKVTQAAKPAFDALTKAQRVFFEIQNDKRNQQDTVALMVLPPQEKRTLSAIIGAADFGKLTRSIHATQPGFPVALLERYRPWAASILVQLPAPTADNIHLDDRLQHEATRLSKEVLGLESPQSQMAVFNDMPEPQQVTMLRDTLNNIDTLRAQNETLKALYIRSDLRGIARLGDDAFSEISNAKIRFHLRDSLIYKRNRTMVKTLQPYLAQGGNFVAIGALHLPGEQGVLQLIEKSGYYIWPAEAPASR